MGRSRITRVLRARYPGDGVDGRRREAKRWKEIFETYANQLTSGAVSVAQGARLRTLATTTLALERLSVQQARGETVEASEIVSLGNLQNRLLAELGITPKSAEPADPLAAYRAKTGIAI